MTVYYTRLRHVVVFPPEKFIENPLLKSAMVEFNLRFLENDHAEDNFVALSSPLLLYQ